MSVLLDMSFEVSLALLERAFDETDELVLHRESKDHRWLIKKHVEDHKLLIGCYA